MGEKGLLQSNCSLYRVTAKEELDSFSCGDDELDDFFHTRLVSMRNKYQLNE